MPVHTTTFIALDDSADDDKNRSLSSSAIRYPCSNTCPHDWSSIGVRLEFDWSSIGVRLEFDWSSIGVRLEFNWSSIGVRLEFDWSSIRVQLEFN